jgi:hypothetical protein
MMTTKEWSIHGALKRFCVEMAMRGYCVQGVALDPQGFRALELESLQRCGFVTTSSLEAGVCLAMPHGMVAVTRGAP